MWTICTQYNVFLFHPKTQVKYNIELKNIKNMSSQIYDTNKKYKNESIRHMSSKSKQGHNSRTEKNV
jgi:hypothetical protein